MGTIKQSDGEGVVIGKLARAWVRHPFKDLGLQVRDVGSLDEGGFRRTQMLLVDVIRAHNQNTRDNTITSTILVHRERILELADYIRAYDAERKEWSDYQRARRQENKDAGRPLLEGADENGVIPPLHDEGQERQRNDILFLPRAGNV